MGEDETVEGFFFVNICHCGAMWHATSALEAGVAHLGPRMEHSTKFRDPGGQFESLGT